MVSTVKKYSSQKVRELRSKRKLLKSNGSSLGITNDAEYQSFLGELKGAGHLRINGLSKADYTPGIDWDGKRIKNYTMEYQIRVENGDKPHFTGYVQSASNADTKPYKVNAWLNENGQIRLEIVEKK